MNYVTKSEMEQLRLVKEIDVYECADYDTSSHRDLVIIHMADPNSLQKIYDIIGDDSKIVGMDTIAKDDYSVEMYKEPRE